MKKNITTNETRHEVETIDEKTTRQNHLTAAEVVEKCQKLADLMADFYGCHLIASDMVLSCQEFAECMKEEDARAPFYFAIRKQGTESGTLSHCRERCRVLGRPVYVLKAEYEAADLFTLTVRVDPVEREARENKRESRTADRIGRTARRFGSASLLLLVRILFIAVGLCSGLAVIFGGALILPEVTPDGFAACLLLRVPAMFAITGLWGFAWCWSLRHILPARLLDYIQYGTR